MKKYIVGISIFWMIITINALGQSKCIDYVIYKIEHHEQKTVDTLYCKIIFEDENNISIDNGTSITSMPKTMIIATQSCAREMTAVEILRYRGIDQISNDLLKYQQSAGSYLRKASYSTYAATGLALLSGGSIALGSSIYKGKTLGTFLIVGGSIIGAGALFCAVLSWNYIYKAGKLLDIGNSAALYLQSTSDGNLGLSLKW